MAGDEIELEAKIGGLQGRIFELQSLMSGFCALMEDDIACSKVRGTELRLQMIAKGRAISKIGQ